MTIINDIAIIFICSGRLTPDLCLQHPWLYIERNSNIFVPEPNNNNRENSLIKSTSLEGKLYIK